MATFTQPTRNEGTFLNFLKHGKDLTLDDFANYTFESVVFQDGTQLKDVTFDELAEISWSLVNKSSAPSFTNQNKN